MSQLAIFEARKHRQASSTELERRTFYSCAVCHCRYHVDDLLQSIKTSVNQGQQEVRSMGSSLQEEIWEASDSVQKHTSQMDNMLSLTVATIQDVSSSIERHCQQALAMHSTVEAHMETIIDKLGDNQETSRKIYASTQATIQDLKRNAEQTLLPQIRGFSEELRRDNRQLLKMTLEPKRDSVGKDFKRGANHEQEIPQSFSASRCVWTIKLWTPLGWLHTASIAHRREACKRGDITTIGYRVLFEPFRFLGSGLVEWRCLLGIGVASPFMTIWCTVGQVCDDEEVVDAMGFIPCDLDCTSHGYHESPHWHSKAPSYRKLRRLLDERCFMPGDLIKVPWKRNHMMPLISL